MCALKARTRLFVSLFLLVTSAQLARAEEVPDLASADWLGFRGDPEQRGYRAGRIRRLSLLWTFEAGTGSESTAAITKDTVVVGTDGGLLALALAPRGDDGAPVRSGKKLWALDTEGQIRAAPAVRDGVAFVGDDFGVFRAVTVADGSEVWTFDPDTGAEILGAAAFHGESVLYGSYDGNLYCLEAKTGKLVWQLETGGPVHATPAIAAGHTFVAGCDELLHVVDLEKGQEVSSFPLGSNCASSPAVVGDDLFVGTFANQVLRIRWRGLPSGDGSGKSVAPDADRRAERRPPTEAGTTTEGEASGATGTDGASPDGARAETPAGEKERGAEHLIWRYEHPRRKFPYYASPSVAPLGIAGEDGETQRNVVVIGGRDKFVHALNAQSGEALWTLSTGARVDGSAVIVGDSVVVGGMDRTLYLLELSTGKERWRYTATAPFAASPAVAHGRVVITSQDGVVHCFEAEDESP